MSTMTAELALEGQVRWSALAGSGHSLVIDGPREAGGEGAGFRPMELMLMGLGGCIGYDVAMILRRMRLEVTGYRLKLVGQRAEDPPAVYTEVHLEHVISGNGLTEAAVHKAMRLAQKQYCSAWAMFCKTATLTSSFRIENQTQAADDRQGRQAKPLRKPLGPSVILPRTTTGRP